MLLGRRQQLGRLTLFWFQGAALAGGGALELGYKIYFMAETSH